MKTIKEVAEMYSKMDTNKTNQQNRLIGFKAGVEFAQRWIDVNDELPELTTGLCHNAVNVKLTTIHGDIRECTAVLEPVTRHCFENSPVDLRWYVYPSGGHELKTVTHWRPIELL